VEVTLARIGRNSLKLAHHFYWPRHISMMIKVESKSLRLSVIARLISKRATPRNGMTKPGNFDPAICTLKSSGQILIGLAYTWSASTRLLGHGKVTTGWLWHDQALIRLTAF
jgi:hypothetical protein